MTEGLLLYGDTERSADLFHTIPLVIIDPFAYLETNGRRLAVVPMTERERVLGLGLGIEVLDPAELGRDELLAQGLDYDDAELEIVLRACRRAGIETVVVAPSFPVTLADHLRAGGVEVRPDRERVLARRRAKTPAQLDGIRRAQAAADAAMARAAQLLREADGGLPTAEDVRAAMTEVCDAHGCDLPEDVIVGPGGQGALGHEPGHGPIARGESLIVDIWPRDRRSRCWADMTRTFVAGEPPEEIARWHALCLEVHERVRPLIRPGFPARELHRAACEVFEREGIPTQLSVEPGTVLEDGFWHGLGHGVGLEIHERPFIGRSNDELVAGDVLTLEPGCYRKGFGGVRLEDLALVTEDGCEVLTDFPYDLAP